MRIDNAGANKRHCSWCDNSGWVYLLRWEKRKNMRGDEYEQQVLAPCRMCALGEKRYAETRGPYDYRADEVDVSMDGRDLAVLPVEQQDAYQRAYRAVARSLAGRTEQLSLSPGLGPQSVVGSEA